MIWMIRDILVCCFQVYMLNDLGRSYLTYNNSPNLLRFLNYAIIISVIWKINGLESTIGNMIGVPICYVVVLLLVFQGSIWKKVILSFCFYMLAIAPEFMFASVTNAYGVHGHPDAFQNEMEKTLAIILMKLVTFLFVKCIGQIRRKRNYQSIENKTFTVLLMLPAATIIILGSIYYAHIPLTGVNKIVLPSSTFLLLLTNVVTFSIFDRLIENAEKARKMERLYQKSRAEIENLKYLSKIDDEHKAFLHDVSRFARTAGELVVKGEIKEAMAILTQIGTRIQNIREFQYSSDALLNSILSERKFVADSKGIRYHVDIEGGLNIKAMEELDVISIVGNLLDNAIEAAGKVEDSPYAECKMYMATGGNFLMMEFQNNFKIQPQIGKEGYISSKREPGSYGVGLHTVEKLVKQYNGIMKTEINGRTFKVSLAFSNKG